MNHWMVYHVTSHWINLQLKLSELVSTGHSRMLSALQISNIKRTPPAHHNHFTALFPGPPGWAGARGELLNFMVQGKINRGRHTDHPAGRHSIRTNHFPPPPSPTRWNKMIKWLTWNHTAPRNSILTALLQVGQCCFYATVYRHVKSYLLQVHPVK